MNKSPQIDDCFVHDKDRLRHHEALKILKTQLSVIVKSEAVTLGTALGRIVNSDIVAPHAVPLHTNSAVDGYAYCHADFSDIEMDISATIAAGDLHPLPLTSGTAARIFTGASMPKGADTIAMQEDCKKTGDKVRLPKGQKAGANCRKAGEDLNQGDVVIPAGTRLKAADVAAIASIGISEISVYKKLQIALFASGNELREAGHASLRHGEVFNTNTPMIAALCKHLPFEVEIKGVVRDTLDETLEALKDAARQNDVIIATGGASRGDEDHMLPALDSLGKRHLWQLAVKPGRPMMFGQIQRENGPDCLFFGLPGNPVAAMVCFLLYTRPALLKLSGSTWQTPNRYPLPADFAVPHKKTDRREFMRGHLRTTSDGTLTVQKFERDGSGLISSLRLSDGLIEIPEDVGKVELGDTVSFIPFSAFD